MDGENQEQQELEGIVEPEDEVTDGFNETSEDSSGLVEHEELVEQADRLESLHSELDARLSGHEDPSVS